MGLSKRPFIFVISLVSFMCIGPNAYAQDGSDLYELNCSSCHGASFEGTGLGPKLSTASYKYGGRQEDFVRLMKSGAVPQGMPSFQQTLSDKQITAIAGYLPARNADDLIKEEASDSSDQESTSGSVLKKVSTLDYLINMEVVAEGLDVPWAIAFPTADTILVSERAGNIRVIKNGKLDKRPVADIPKVLISSHKWNQGGLLDIALDPNYKTNGWVYLCYSHPVVDKTISAEPLGMIRVVRGKIKRHAWVNQEVVYEASLSDYNTNFYHYGGRLVFDSQGYLYVSVGDRGAQEQARDLSRANGKIHRIHPNGDIPKDNPFLATENALPSIFSAGHRNPQGLALAPSTGKIWATEHGPRGGDELNILNRGGDYGWPVVSHGINYDGTLLTPNTRAEGVEQPALYWRPSIAVSGIAFYRGQEFPLWKDKLLVTGLKTRELSLLTIDQGRIQHQEKLMTFEGRPYEPFVGPDGAVYIVTDAPGQLIRLSAERERKL